MMPGTLSIITNAFPPHERGKAIGTWAGVSAIALALGPLLGGWLTEDVSWRAIFFINLPVAAGAVAVTLFAVHESRDETVGRERRLPRHRGADGRPDRARARAVEGNSWGWGSPAILGLLALASSRSPRSSSSSAASRRRSSTSSAALQAVRRRERGRASSISFAMLAMFFFLALYMQNILGYSPLEAGVRFLPDDGRDRRRRADRRAARGPHRPAAADGRRAARS